MTDIAKKLALVFVLWLPLSLVALVAIPLSLAALLVDDMPYAKNVLRAMDKLAAAILGRSGYYTVSAEGGVPGGACPVCAWICRLIERVQPGHCRRAAEHEGRK